MRWRYIAYVLGTLVLCFGLTMIVPLAFALYYRDTSIIPIVSAMTASIAIGLLLFFFFKQTRVTHISQREGMAIVALGWTVVGLFGALPFYFHGDQQGKYTGIAIEKSEYQRHDHGQSEEQHQGSQYIGDVAPAH